MIDQEIWKDICLKGKEYNYQISNYGRVKNKKTGRILKLQKRGQHKGNYSCVDLCKYGIRQRIDIQRLVAIHFISNVDHKSEVNHLDGDHYNNRVDNLEWCTRSENERHKRFLEGCREVENEG